MLKLSLQQSYSTHESQEQNWLYYNLYSIKSLIPHTSNDMLTELNVKFDDHRR